MINKLGFDEWFCSQVTVYKESRDATHTDRYANSIWDNNGRHFEYSQYGPDQMQEYAFDYIDRQVEAGKPFMLYYTEPLVHTPHVSTPDCDEWDLDYGSRFTAGQRQKMQFKEENYVTDTVCLPFATWTRGSFLEAQNRLR
jgi:arylsulfatase A